MRVLCEHHNALGVALDVPEQLPAAEVVDRWLGEPVKAVLLPLTCFTTNKRGYPTLPKRHQEFVALMFKNNVQVGGA